MRRKEARVEVRMTEHEKEALKRKAAKNGMTVSEYARTLLANSDDATIRVIDTEPLRKAAHELAKQGTNLNQFMKFLNTYGIKVFDAGEAQRVLAREVETFMEVAEALAALRREAERNNICLQIEDFDNAETTDEGKERVDGQASPSTLNQVWSSVSTVASIPPSVNESA